eukprot:547181-Amphidinium_carterae.1
MCERQQSPHMICRFMYSFARLGGEALPLLQCGPVQTAKEHTKQLAREPRTWHEVHSVCESLIHEWNTNV